MQQENENDSGRERRCLATVSRKAIYIIWEIFLKMLGFQKLTWMIIGTIEIVATTRVSRKPIKVKLKS